MSQNNNSMEIFKKLFGSGLETTVMERPVQPQKTEQELIEEIHNEFDTAPERILQQALSIISEQQGSKVSLESEIEDKAVRLRNLGFVKNGIVNKLGEIEKRNKEKDLIINMETKMAQGIRYYARTYPFLKFLPVSELDRICDKYGLVYAPVKHYKMPVPDKNLQEIENAQRLNPDDEQKNLVTYKFVNQYSGKQEDFNKVAELFGGDTFTTEELERIHIQYFGEIIKHRIADTFWEYGYLASKGKIKNPVIRESFIADAVETTYDRTGLFIAAPKEHFDLTDLTFDKKKGYFQTTIQIKKDPIVFRYVKGGIQVLSKWGLEADDPALQMEILN